jgi:hypothetical protein
MIAMTTNSSISEKPRRGFDKLWRMILISFCHVACGQLTIRKKEILYLAIYNQDTIRPPSLEGVEAMDPYLSAFIAGE